MYLLQHLTNIIKLSSTNPVVSLLAPLNFRKTIELPLEIHKNDARCYVVVASFSVAIDLAEHQNKLDAAIVGYGVSEDQTTIDDNTTIAYVTAEYMWKKLLTYQGTIDFTDVIMLDELYPGEFDYEMIISIWKKAYDFGVPRLIISHSLPIIFSNLIVKEYLIKPIDLMIKYQYQEKADIVTIINSLIKMPGDILIITPDDEEKNNMINLLIKSDINDNIVDVIISELNYGINGKVGKKNIIVVTNNEATAIRINNINFIINTMKIKRKIAVPSGGFRLITDRVDKKTIKQYESFFDKGNNNNTYYVLANEKDIPVSYYPLITNNDIYHAIKTILNYKLDPTKYLDFINKEEVIKSINFVKKSIIFKNEDFQYFFPNFQLSVRNSAFLWNWIKGLRFNDKTIQEGKKYGLNLENLEIDITSEYSSIRPYHIADIDRIFVEENINPESIIDATANIGGDSINFLRMYPNVKLTALEIDNKIAMMLRRNLENATQIINAESVDYDTKVINISAVKYFNKDRYADIIYLDPEWGGVNYKSAEKIELKLDDIGVGVLIGNILRKGMTPLILLKAPNNVNLEIILQDINLKIDYNIHDIAGSYKLIVIRYEMKRIANVDEDPNEVDLTFSTYPIFPGIVTTCLIDCSPYNPSKFTGYNDLETSLNMWNDMIKTLGSLFASEQDIFQWCRSNNINYNKISELIKLIKDTIKSVMKLGFGEEIIERTFTTMGVMTAARPILAKVYQDQTMIHKNEYLYFNPVGKEIYRLDNKNIVSDIHKNPPIGLIVLASTEIKTARGTLKLITFAIDTDKDGLGRMITKNTKSISSENVLTKEKKTVDIKQENITENPFDILDSLKVPRLGQAIRIDDRSADQLMIKNKITKGESLTNFYGKLKGANKWSSKTIKTDKYDWLKKYLYKETDIYLDIGTGSGEDFAIINKISKAKLGLTADIVDNRNEKNSEFFLITKNVELDLEDKSIDLFTIFHAIHHSKDALFRLKDITRMMKKDGILIIKDHDINSAEDANNVSFEHLVYSIGEGSATIANVVNYNEIEPMYYYPAYYIKNYLKNLGLQEIHFESYPGPTKVYFAIFRK